MTDERTATSQPSGVTEKDTPPERPENVLTEEPEVTAARKAAESASDEPDQTSDESDPSKSKKRARKRHRTPKASRRIKALQSELSAANAKNAELEERVASLEAGHKTEPKPEPKLADFNTPQEYAAAYTKWVDDQKAAKKPGKKPAKKPDAQGQPDDEPPLDVEALKDFHNDGVERLGDAFLEARQDDSFGISRVMGEFIIDSEIGPEIFVHLHQNPELSRKIYYKTEDVAIEALEQLAEALENDPDSAPTDDDEPTRDKHGRFKSKGKRDDDLEDDDEPLTVTTKSKAPTAPPDPDKGSKAPDVDLDKANMDDYAATRRKQMAARGRHG